MSMRITFSVLYIVLILALLFCGWLTNHSDRPQKNAVALLEMALIPPVLGNLLIVATDVSGTALTGCYLYYIGMDVMMYALLDFSIQYCSTVCPWAKHFRWLHLALIADAVQLMLNPVFGHAFTTNPVNVEGRLYYKLVPFFGQTVHRITDYTVFFVVILIFVIASLKAPKLYRERYLLILCTMACVGLVQTYNIFFQYAIDRSMLGYGFFGLVIYYFSIIYRPIRILDRMLSNIVSDLSDAFYIFDPNGNCLWANPAGCRLADFKGTNYEEINPKLIDMFGSPEHSDAHIIKKTIGEGADARFFILEENLVKDSRGRLDGSYLRIQDVTEGEQELRARDEQLGQIRQEAYKDPLTGVGSKAAYTKKVAELNAELSMGAVPFAVVMVDMNNLKHINDDYGHKAGDRYIKGCCHLICEAFKHSPVFRIGGDEFVVILQGHDYKNRVQNAEHLRRAFRIACEKEHRDPWLKFSAAVGMAENTAYGTAYEPVFRRADNAMYEEKKQFKKQHGSYR